MADAPMREPPLSPGTEGRITSPAQRMQPDLRRFLLLEDAFYDWWHPLRGEDPPELYRLVARRGFEHDFASVPRPLWMLISPLDLGLASLFHDWLYRHGGRVETLRWSPATGAWSPVDRPWTRVQADELFARIMREQGVPRWRRRAAYLAVRVAGRSHWRSVGTAR